MKLIYLDQNGLSQLAFEKNEDLRTIFIDLVKKKTLSLVLGFPHIYETAKATEKKRRVINNFVERVPWIQFRPLIDIFDSEVKNQFYKFLGLGKRIDQNVKGAIFPKLRLSNPKFNDLVSFAAKNTNQAELIKQSTLDHDIKMKKILATHSGISLSDERQAALIYFRDTVLKDKISAELPIELPPSCLNDEEFINGFNWQEARLLDFYLLYQFYLYKDKLRNPSGDLADVENVVLGAAECDYLMVEKFSYQILSQIKHAGIKYKAEIYPSISDLIDDISK